MLGCVCSSSPHARVTRKGCDIIAAIFLKDELNALRIILCARVYSFSPHVRVAWTLSNVIDECNTDAAKYLKDEPDVFRKSLTIFRSIKEELLWLKTYHH